jgi:hypothetical protein
MKTVVSYLPRLATSNACVAMSKRGKGEKVRAARAGRETGTNGSANSPKPRKSDQLLQRAKIAQMVAAVCACV